MSVFLVGSNNMAVEFTKGPPSNIISNRNDGCCNARSSITLTMWLFKPDSGATIFTLLGAGDAGPIIVLKMLSGGNIQFFLKGETARLVTFTTCNEF